MQFISILGRQPALGIAELEGVFGAKSVSVLSPMAALIESNEFDIQRLGGSPKAGKVVAELTKCDWHKVSQKIVQRYADEWSSFGGKITLGISAYGFKTDAREVQKTGIILKQKLKKSGVSLRLVPNSDPTLNSAVSHHNKLGLSANKVELLVVCASNGKVVIAESVGSQNITAYANRDQERPKRDAFVGMLPPKLAQIMINLAIGQKSRLVIAENDTLEAEFEPTPGLDSDPERSSVVNDNKQKDELERTLIILDPFCGTGVILQEAALMGFSVYGTDLSEKMVRYSRDNLNWLADTHHVKFDWYLREDDAIKAKWRQPINAVVSETYLGQPFSAPPSPSKLEEVVQNCNHIISQFLTNLSGQIEPGTPICIAVPAWRGKDGNFTHLPLISTIARLGYKPHEFANISQNDLLYFRENQVVARELLVLTRS